MSRFDMIANIRRKSDRSAEMVSNASELGGSYDRSLHIVWLYPDILNIHGGRGDVMALLHVGNLMGLPVEIKRCNSLRDDIPFEWADMIYLSACPKWLLQWKDRERPWIGSSQGVECWWRWGVPALCWQCHWKNRTAA